MTGLQQLETKTSIVAMAPSQIYTFISISDPGLSISPGWLVQLTLLNKKKTKLGVES
jgi:hypothetical protein